MVRPRYVLRRKPPGKLLPSAMPWTASSGHLRPQQDRRADTAGLRLVRGRDVSHGLLIMEYCDGRVLWIPCCRSCPGGGSPSIAPSSRPWSASAGSTTSPGPCRLRPAGQLRAARSSRGASSTRRRRPKRSSRWTGCSTGCRAPAGQYETVLVHGDYRLDNMIFHPTEPGCWASSMGISTLGDRWPSCPISAAWRSQGLGRARGA